MEDDFGSDSGSALCYTMMVVVAAWYWLARPGREEKIPGGFLVCGKRRHQTRIQVWGAGGTDQKATSNITYQSGLVVLGHIFLRWGTQPTCELLPPFRNHIPWIQVQLETLHATGFFLL